MSGFSFLRRKRGPGGTLHVAGSDRTAPIVPGDTLLGAAVREGLPLPHMCNAGECGACKIRLTRGHVRLEKDISRHVSSEDLECGYLLACQSVAESPDIEVEVPGLGVDFPASPAPVLADATIAREIPLAPGILGLELTLSADVRYVAGQYAQLTVPGLSALREPRCYSFAEAPSPASPRRVLFHVGHVPGGVFTDWLFAADRTGARIGFSGPYGRFRYHEVGRPLLCVAGGTGLAPIKAILEQALSDGLAHDVTLLVGARTQRDLYALDAVAALKERWRGRFTFVPVLSREPEDSGWRGPRGHVTDCLREHAEGLADCAAYLCGSPGLIDSVVSALQGAIPPEHVHCDRFLHRGSVALAAASKAA